MTFDLKTITPDTSLPSGGFLFGADSQSAASPGVYSRATAAAGLLEEFNLYAGTNLVEQYNSTNAQAFNIYNTRTDGSNYERAFAKWSGNVFEIGTEAAGTGTLRNPRLVRGSSYVEIQNGNVLLTNGSSNAAQLLADWWEPATATGAAHLGRAAKKWGDLYTQGTVVMSNLPTTDPTNAGQLWNDAGTVKVSAG